MIDPQIEDLVETLSPLDIEEADDITFPFLDLLKTGETVASASVSIDVVKGVDPTPVLCKVGSESINGTDGYVVQRIQGRLPNVTYRLRCKMTLNTGRVIVKAAYLPVLRY